MKQDSLKRMYNYVLPGFGIGFSFRGKTYRNETEREQNISAVTRWFVLMHLPVIPLSSWLVQDKGSRVNDFRPNLKNYVVTQRVPVLWPQVLKSWLFTASVVAFVVIAYVLLP